MQQGCATTVAALMGEVSLDERDDKLGSVG